MLERNDECYYVVEDDRFIGVITIHDLPKLMEFNGDYKLLLAKDLVNEDYIKTTPDEFLINILHKFEYDYIEEIPVVDRKDNDRLVGIISRRDIIETYEHEILRKSMRDLKYIDDVDDSEISENVELPDTHKLREISVPKVLDGLTLAEVDMGAKFGITVVGIKRIVKNKEEFIIPHGTTKFEEGDRMLIIVKQDSMERFLEYIKKKEDEKVTKK
jgi:CIC family chloride channel protein